MTLSVLCREHTALSEEEINCLLAVEKQLPLIAEITNADVFIDCQLSETRALVVAQAGSSVGTSAYSGRIVGQYAIAENEPAVFQTFRMGMPMCDMKATTQEGWFVRQNVAPIRNAQGRVIAVLVREKDISEELLKQQRYESLARSYETKAPDVRAETPAMDRIAVLETHHRVKNSLQQVASILNLQARNSDNEQVRTILKENVGRILSIATVHDILTHTQDDLHGVSAGMLLERLASSLCMLNPPGKDIRILTQADCLMLSANTASSVALVVAELVTNAFRHAFAARETGTVQVTLCAGKLFHTVSVTDNGVGFEPQQRSRQSIGLSIVDATVRDKLHGRLHIRSGVQGTTVTFDFQQDTM